MGISKSFPNGIFKKSIKLIIKIQIKIDFHHHHLHVSSLKDRSAGFLFLDTTKSLLRSDLLAAIFFIAPE